MGEITFLGVKHQIHKSWMSFFDSNQELLAEIENTYSRDGVIERVSPLPKNIFKVFANTDASELKVVIIGTDPLKDNEIATGRAFEVEFETWREATRIPSIRAFLNTMYYVHSGIVAELDSCKDALHQIENGFWHISPPNIFFKELETQGVLMLNRSLTITDGNQLEREKQKVNWKGLILQLVNRLCSFNENIKWVLWGDLAKELKKTIKDSLPDEKIDIEERIHPSAYSYYMNTSTDPTPYWNDFIKNSGWKAVLEKLKSD